MMWSLTVAAIVMLAPQVANAQQLLYPLDVAVGAEEAIYIADRNLPGVWKLHEGKLSTYFQASKKFRTPLNAVRCVAIDPDGLVLAGDSSTRDIYRFDMSGKPHALAEGNIQIPMDVAVHQDGDLLASDLLLNRIWKTPAKGGEPKLFAEIPAPTGLFMDAQNQLWVVSRSAKPLWRVSPSGEAEAVIKERLFQFPQDVVVDEEQNVFISDSYANTIWKMAPEKQPEKWVEGKPLTYPIGLAWRGKNIIVADPRAKAIFQITPEGKVEPLKIESSSE